MVYMLSCAVFGSMRIYDHEEKRLFMPWGSTPIIVTSSWQEKIKLLDVFSENGWFYELVKGVEGSRDVPIRLLSLIGLIWLVRFALVQLCEVVRLLHEEPTYNITVRTPCDSIVCYCSLSSVFKFSFFFFFFFFFVCV
jgi:hypothetical protein